MVVLVGSELLPNLLSQKAGGLTDHGEILVFIHSRSALETKVNPKPTVSIIFMLDSEIYFHRYKIYCFHNVVVLGLPIKRTLPILLFETPTGLPRVLYLKLLDS